MITDLLRTYSFKNVFIETGTKDGNTLWEAKDIFSRCFSIELDKENYKSAVERLKDYPQVVIAWGESKQWLPKVIDPTKSTLFYLDAHYEGGELLYQKPECPLMDELKVIVETNWTIKPVILIDDWNMFDPMYWNDPESNHHLFTPNEWPRHAEIVALLKDYQLEEDKENRVGIFT